MSELPIPLVIIMTSIILIVGLSFPMIITTAIKVNKILLSTNTSQEKFARMDEKYSDLEKKNSFDWDQHEKDHSMLERRLDSIDRKLDKFGKL